MSNATLTVKNFGPINDATLDLRKVTVLIGEQASGKSVLAKLAAIFGDILLEEEDLESQWEFFGLRNFLQKDSSICFSNQEFKHVWENGKFEKTLKDPNVERLFNHYQESRLSSQNIPLTHEQISDLQQQKNYLKYKGGSPEYIPAERALIPLLDRSIFDLINNRVNLPGFLVKFATDYRNSKIMGVGEKSEIPFLNVSFGQEEGESKVWISSEKSIKLNESASGYQAVIPMALVLKNIRTRALNPIFIIEEPELNLFPSTQKGLVEYLIKECIGVKPKRDNRLILTTHSPYILSALDNCIQANNVLRVHPEAAEKVNALVAAESQISFDDVSAYFVSGGGVRSIMDEENRLIDGNALDDISDELGETFDKLLDLELQTS